MNRQVKRNIERFPDDFMFQITKEELNGLKCQNGISNSRGGDRSLPYAFKEQGIFFDGQIYDAYAFVAGLVRRAEERIVLIDNYIDDTVLTLLDKRKENVEATVYTSRLKKETQLDIMKHNAQYRPVKVNEFRKAHDRFMIIDEKVYLIGASIKDLGKKWFGFTLMECVSAEDILKRL